MLFYSVLKCFHCFTYVLKIFIFFELMYNLHLLIAWIGAIFVFNRIFNFGGRTAINVILNLKWVYLIHSKSTGIWLTLQNVKLLIGSVLCFSLSFILWFFSTKEDKIEFAPANFLIAFNSSLKEWFEQISNALLM